MHLVAVGQQVGGMMRPLVVVIEDALGSFLPARWSGSRDDFQGQDEVREWPRARAPELRSVE